MFHLCRDKLVTMRRKNIYASLMMSSTENNHDPEKRRSSFQIGNSC